LLDDVAEPGSDQAATGDLMRQIAARWKPHQPSVRCQRLPP
jgi:hypothetical protein